MYFHMLEDDVYIICKTLMGDVCGNPMHASGNWLETRLPKPSSLFPRPTHGPLAHLQARQ